MVIDMNTEGPNDAGDELVLRVNEDDPDLEMDEDLYYSYRDEPFTGVMTEYYPNGTLAAEVAYKGGKPDGWGRSWYDDGTPKTENFVRNRRVDGIARAWHRNGVVSEERRFRDGEFVEVNEWDEQGNLIVKPPVTRGFNIPQDPDRAARTERSLLSQVERDQPLPSPLVHVAAVDLRHLDGDGARILRAAAVLFDAESGLEQESSAVDHTLKDAREFSLNFEETLAAVEALRGLTIPAGVIVCPGNGPNHGTDLNLATHLGLATGKPTFGLSDSAYVGTYAEPGPQRGAATDLVDDEGGVLGRALRTQEGAEPVFVTQGQRLALDAAVELTLRLTENSRLPLLTTAAANLTQAS